MTYACRYLKFGEENDQRIPGYESDLLLSNVPVAPIPQKLVDQASNEILTLVFSYASGQFFTRGAGVPGVDGATIRSWYAGSGPPGPPILSLTPFVMGESEGCPGGFVRALQFVDFSETPTGDSAIRTDTITNPSVTATVHRELPQYAKVEVSQQSSSHSVIITTRNTRVVFDRIFVYDGSGVVADNAIAVQKNQSCFALAVFKCETAVASREEISTYQWPKIPEWEWPMIIARFVKDFLVRENAEVWQYVTPKSLAVTEPEALKKAVTLITKRITELEKIKVIIANLARQKEK